MQQLNITSSFTGMIKVLFNAILPILFAVLAFIIWLGFFLIITYMISKRKNHKNFNISSKLLLFTVLAIYMFYPSIIKSCFGMFDCVHLDPDVKITYLKVYLDLECWSKSHIIYILIFAFPGILIWGIGFPAFLAYVLRKNRNFLQVD